MSLDTLLEAAKYLESSSRLTSKDDSAIARVHHSSSVHTERRRAISECEAFERRRRPGGAGTRETHNKLEKNRRAHLKECFDILKREVPSLEDKKTSNLNILRSALKHIQALKKRERDFEAQRDLLKISNNTIKQRLLVLRKEITIQLEIAQKSAQNGVIPKTCPVVSEASSTKTSVNLKSSEIQCSPISVATQTSFTSGEESDVDCSSVNAIKMEGGQVNALCNGTVNVGHESKDKVASDDEDEDVDVEGEITDDNTEDVDALIKDERVKNAKMVNPAEPVPPSGSRPKRKAGAGDDGNKLEAKKSNIQCCARVSC